MVGLTGFEPVTSRLSGGRSNQLSYRPAGAVRSSHDLPDIHRCLELVARTRRHPYTQGSSEDGSAATLLATTEQFSIGPLESTTGADPFALDG